MSKKIFLSFFLLLLLVASAIAVQGQTRNSNLDSLMYYQRTYNLRIKNLTQAELGETLAAIGKMTIQDTATFNVDSLKRVIARGQKIIDEDKTALYLRGKYEHFLALVKKGEARKED
ncbi:MAG: hypothetical protein MRZ79_24720 [Bacteroidia bacterium]|nr:hypothetical protein [Bacteroidia bacterium]